MTRLLALSLLGSIGFAATSAAAEPIPGALQKAARFPALEAESLTEESVKLPDALEGRGGIVIFAFSRDGGGAAADWHRALREGLDGDVAPDIWQVMMLEDVPGLVRGFVTGGIKRGMPEDMHTRSLTLFKDGDLWRRRCGVESDDIPCVILVDAAGRIQWIRTAAVNDALIDSLRQAVIVSQPPSSTDCTFDATLADHLEAIETRDLDALIAMLTSGDALTLIFPDGDTLDTKQEYIDFHRDWFEDESWNMQMTVLRTIETAELGHALARYRYSSRTESGGPMSAKISWRLRLPGKTAAGGWCLTRIPRSRLRDRHVADERKLHLRGTMAFA